MKNNKVGRFLRRCKNVLRCEDSFGCSNLNAGLYI